MEAKAAVVVVGAKGVPHRSVGGGAWRRVGEGVVM